MSSFAPVNHPPFAYDPSCKPTKSILKHKNRLTRNSTSWFSSLNSRLSSASASFSLDNSELATTDSNSNNAALHQQQEPLSQPPQHQPISSRPLSLLNFRRFINNAPNSNSDAGSINSFGTSSLLENKTGINDEDLAPDELKRVRFSVGQLTTEYYPYQNQASSDEEPSTASSGDAPELPEDAAALLLAGSSNNTEPPKSDEQSAASEIMMESKVTTPRQLFEIYETACQNKEEPMMTAFIASLNAHQHLSTLTHLDLSNQPMTRRAVEPIADVLGLQFGLEKLVLDNCGLEDDAIKILLHSLLLNDGLQHLSLASNKKLKTNGFKYIAIYIKGSSKLRYLDLSYTNLDKKAIQYLSQAIITTPTNPTAPSLKELILDDCQLKSPMIEILTSGVRRSACLEILSLRNNRINHQGALWLGVMLRDYDEKHGSRGLSRLYIDHNDIRQGIQYIAQALRRNQRLQTLSMRECKLDSKGCALVGEALKYNDSLIKLDMSLNGLNHPTTEGMMAIKQALYVNRSLKELYLEATGLDSEAAVGLAECIPENRSLTRLDLSRNLDIDLAGLMALSASVRINHTLTFLDVNVPPNDRDMAKVQSDIVAACTRNAQNSADCSAQEQPPPLRRSGSLSAFDPNAMVTRTQATARLSLQERLAAVTRGKISKANKPALNNSGVQRAQEQEAKKILAEPGIIDLATSQVDLFEEMLSAEADQLDDIEDIIPIPGDAITQVYSQCKKSQILISDNIHRVTDTDQLAQLLSVNDRLTAAIAQYQRLFPPVPPEPESKPEPIQAKPEPETFDAVLLQNVNSDPSKLAPSTSFAIGDADEDDDDSVPPRHPSPGVDTVAKVADESAAV